MKKLFGLIVMFCLLLTGCSSSNDDSSTHSQTVSKEKAQDGDIVKIDFVGKINGEKFDGGSANDQVLELGAHQYIDGFEEQIVGMENNTDRTITIHFPQNYTGDLAGKEATFDIHLYKIYKKI